jgi:transposase
MDAPEHTIISVGIDVSKATLAIARMRSDRSIVHESIANDEASIATFMQSLSESMADPHIPVVIKSTGDFHVRSAILLREGGFSVKCINPIISKQLENRDIRGAKTDKADAGRLAKLGADEPLLADFTASRQDIWARKHAGTIAKMLETIQQLSSALRRSEETAATLGLPMNLSHLKHAIDALRAQIEVSEAALAERIDPRFAAIARETRGVSQKQMAVLSVFLAGKTFSDRDQLVAFVGLDVRTRESGMWRGRSRISKRGNPFLRRTLFLMGWSLALHNPAYQKAYRDKKESGAHHYTCVIACARKFLRHLYSELYGRGATAGLSADARSIDAES